MLWTTGPVSILCYHRSLRVVHLPQYREIQPHGTEFSCSLCLYSVSPWLQCVSPVMWPRCHREFLKRSVIPSLSIQTYPPYSCTFIVPSRCQKAGNLWVPLDTIDI